MNWKVKELLQTKKRESSNWTVYYHNMVMEDWSKISIWKKQDNSYKVGDSIEYEIVSTDEYGTNKIKEIKPFITAGKQWFSKDYKRDSITMVLSFAKDLVVAWKLDIKDLEKWADKLYARVLSKLD
jgi:hypothetical protein